LTRAYRLIFQYIHNKSKMGFLDQIFTITKLLLKKKISVFFSVFLSLVDAKCKELFVWTLISMVLQYIQPCSPMITLIITHVESRFGKRCI
jgi:hypothetical protein